MPFHPALFLTLLDPRFPWDQGYTIHESIEALGYWNVTWREPGCTTELRPGPKFGDWDVTAANAEHAAAATQIMLQRYGWPLPARVIVRRHGHHSTIGGRVLVTHDEFDLPRPIHLPLEPATDNLLLAL